MSKYVYAENYNFMLGCNSDNPRVVLPFQDPTQVKESINIIPVYVSAEPLTQHPYLNTDVRKTVKSSRIVKMVEKDGFWEVTTFSDTVYRLITE